MLYFPITEIPSNFYAGSEELQHRHDDESDEKQEPLCHAVVDVVVGALPSQVGDEGDVGKMAHFLRHFPTRF